MADAGRVVSLVLCRGEQLLGTLPPVQVQLPWWPEVSDIVAETRRRYGIDVVVLRLLQAPTDRRQGGHLAYLAETKDHSTASLQEWLGPDPIADQPHRQAWARPGGPSEHLGWATARLEEQDRRPTGPPEQIKTWNLSALWRIPTKTGRVWLKATPPFLAHEGAVASLVGSAVAPKVLAYRPGLMLMEELAGEDNFEATGRALRPMVDMLTGLQQAMCARTEDVLGTGAPDRRLPAMVPRIHEVVDAWSHAMSDDQRRRLDDVVGSLESRVEAIGQCGLPDTLVHGDFHPGNVRGPLGRYRILDWGDAYLGPPLVDELAFTRPLSAVDRAAAGLWFSQAWRTAVPGCKPERAADLLRPILPLYAAVVYDDFCTNIEPDELIYHAQDVPAMLTQAAAGGQR